MDETLDAAILKVLVEKAARIRRAYGFSPPYFGDETTILDLLAQHDVTLGPKQLGLFDDATPPPIYYKPPHPPRRTPSTRQR
jgi:hypothetical protein